MLLTGKIQYKENKGENMDKAKRNTKTNITVQDLHFKSKTEISVYFTII